MFGRKRGKARAVLALAGLITALLVSTAPAGAQGASGEAANDYLIVTLTGAPAAHDDTTKTAGRFDPTSQGYQRTLDRMQRQHARFIERLGVVAPNAVVTDEFFVTANAVVVKLNGSDSSQITTISGVERVQMSTLYRPAMDQSVDLITAPAFWAANGGRSEAGDDVTVGVIDSGIVNSAIPGYQPFFVCDDRTVTFGGVYYSGVTGLPAIGVAQGDLPSEGFLYVSDHGTHVAGTIGGCVYTIPTGFWAGTTLSGVAPKVDLVDYNVFPGFGAGWVAYGGSAFSHDIAEAIEDAVADGVDVINMSLSGGNQGPHDFLAEVSNAAVAAGVVVVAATGNDGPDYYTAGSPATGSEVIGVGATTNTRGVATLVVTNEAGAPSYDAEIGDFALFDGVTSYEVYDWSGSNEGCTAIAPASYDLGDVVVISRGSCSFTTKVRNAQDAGAGGVIIYNNVPGEGAIGMAHDGTSPFPTIPAVNVSLEDGEHLEGAVGAGGIQLEAVIGTFVVPTTPDELADFSNRGPAQFTYAIKPDVVAPGVDILSSLFSGFGLNSGTSMASPHVAGAAAALLGANDWTPEQVKSALVTTAKILPGWDVWQQGGGLIDLEAADAATVFFYPSNASFGGFTGKAPADGSIDIAISGGTCAVTSVTGDGYASASVDGQTLTVEFAGGRTAPTEMYDGYVFLDCHGTPDADYHIPWGAVVNRGG